MAGRVGTSLAGGIAPLLLAVMGLDQSQVRGGEASLLEGAGRAAWAGLAPHPVRGRARIAHPSP